MQRGCKIAGGKSCKTRRNLVLEPSLAQFDGHTRPISLFLTFFFAFRHLKFHFGGPETGSEKKILNGDIKHQTDRFELDPEVARTHFWHLKLGNYSRNASNRGPQKDPLILLRTRLIERLRRNYTPLHYYITKIIMTL